MIPKILQSVRSKGYAIFTNGSYNINIIGVRSASNIPNSFDDTLYLVFKDGCGDWVELCFKITTDPGKYWLENPMRVEGAAILVEGQYRSAYRIDKHRGKYDALCQREAKVKVYRDGNKDLILDHDIENISSGYFGINIHKASATRASTEVNKWSAGCQVFSNPDDFELFMSICRISAEKYSNKFTYTLIEEGDINE